MTRPTTDLPAVRRFTDDGVPTVAVALTGKHGTGREMLLDASDWRNISETLSPVWTVVRMSNVDYVVCCAREALLLAQGAGLKLSYLFLARHIAQPAPNLNVCHVNGDHLDCRRRNLIARTKSDHIKAIHAARRARSAAHRAEQRASMRAANEAAEGLAA